MQNKINLLSISIAIALLSTHSMAQESSVNLQNTSLNQPVLLVGAQRTLACFEAAERKFMIPKELLMGIAEQESSFNPQAVGVNTNGTRDYGLMQINSSWIPKLSKYGVDSKSLFDPCISIDVGAWILSDNIKRHGKSWKAIAKYNAASNMVKGHAYAVKVYDRARRIELAVNGDASKLVGLIGGALRFDAKDQMVASNALRVKNSQELRQRQARDTSVKVVTYVAAESWSIR